MHKHTFDQLAWYTFDALPVKHGFFTRLGGVSTGIWSSLNLSPSTGDDRAPVRENRDRMMRAMGTTRWITSWLVHGNDVRTITAADFAGPDDPDLVYADAMITNERGFALTLRFADCIPVVFYDQRRQAIGIAHAGWKGIVNQVLPATVRAMQGAYGSDPADITAGIGPCIGPDKFEVGPDVAAEIQAVVSERVVIEHPEAKPHVDLWRAAQSQLHAAGVGVIETGGICTASNTHEWFSHRAERGQTGRFGVVIELSE
jgi:polyphenol oxidase